MLVGMTDKWLGVSASLLLNVRPDVQGICSSHRGCSMLRVEATPDPDYNSRREGDWMEHNFGRRRAGPRELCVPNRD